MSYLRRKTFVVLAIVTLNQPCLGNGFLAPFSGFSNQGVGGAGIAGGLVNNASSAQLNPALDAQLNDQFVFSAAPQYQKQQLNTSNSTLNTIVGPGFPPNSHPLKNRTKFYPVGQGGVTKRIGEKIVIGTSWGGGGGYVRYRHNPISPSIPHNNSFNLGALLLPLTVAVQPAPDQSYGISLIVGLAGLKTNVTLPTNPFQETNGHNHLKFAAGLGVRIGGKWDIGSQVSTGLTVSSPVYFTKFNKYKDILPYRIEAPMQVGGGLTWHLCPTTDILTDVVGYFWKLSKIARKTPAQGGFGLRNTFIVSTGINHQIDKDWTVQLGYKYSMTPIRKRFLYENNFNGAHAFVKNNVTAGLKYNLSSTMILGADVSYGFETKLRDSGNGALGSFSRNITVKASDIFGLIGIIWNY